MCHLINNVTYMMLCLEYQHTLNPLPVAIKITKIRSTQQIDTTLPNLCSVLITNAVTMWQETKKVHKVIPECATVVLIRLLFLMS